MASLSFDVGMNIAGVRQGANEIRNILQGLSSEYQSQSIASPVSVQSSPSVSGMAMPPAMQSSKSMELVSKDQHKELMLVGNNLIQALRDYTDNVNRNAKKEAENTRKNRPENVLKDFMQMANLATGLYVAGGQYEISQARKRMKEMQADPYGAQIEEIQGRSNATKSITGIAGNALGIGVGFATGNAILGSLIANAVNQTVGSILDVNAQKKVAALQEEQMKVEMYKKRLDVMDESYMRFGGKNMWSAQSSLLSASKGTGMNIDEFMRVANTYGAYGISEVGTAGQYARAAANTSRYTGADVGSVGNYLGTQFRYGQRDAIGNMNYAYSSAIASGLQKNQFGEFLDGLQSVIENGISKGYLKSTKEVSDTMVMFDKLSGGSKFWQGEQGFNRLNQINNGLANATSLSSNAQLLAFQALNEGTGNPIDTFISMEKGLSVSSFKKLASRFGEVFGGDSFSEIQAWKELTGLNYTGAQQLFQMAHGNINGVTEGQLKQLTANTSVASDKTYVNDQLNRINVTVSGWGARYFDKYLGMLNKIAGGGFIGKSMKPEGYTNNGILNYDKIEDYTISMLKEQGVSSFEIADLKNYKKPNNQFQTELNMAKSKVSTEWWDKYEAASSPEEKAKYRAKALEESEDNKKVLLKIVMFLQKIVENREKNIVITK